MTRLSGSEVAGASLLAALASPPIAAYLLDRLGLAFPPARLLPVAALCALAVFARLWRRSEWAAGELAAFGTVVVGLFGWLLWLARPSLLPLGTGVDLTHHLLLIGFLERHWTLVHDPSVEWWLGEMVHYTPGSQVLAAVAGAAAGRDGLHAVYPLVAAMVALKAGFVFLIARRLLAGTPARMPLALASVALLLVPSRYFLGSFLQDAFVAQVAGELFAVGMWWTLVVFESAPRTALMGLFALGGMATFLTWPIWVGAPMVALPFVLAAVPRRSIDDRVHQFALAVGPILAVAALYLPGRLGWVLLVRTPGAVVTPSIRELGPMLLVLAAVGLVLMARQPRLRATPLFAGAIALEAVGLFAAARTYGSGTPYMALKMFFLLVYPLAVAGAFALAWGLRAATKWTTPARERLAGWVALAACAFLAVRPLASAPPPTRAVSEPLYRAGAWAREHVPASCVEYLVADPATAYWLHLSVLGNRRMSARTGDNATFDRTQAIVRWLTPGGLPYAVADLPSLPSDVRSDLEIVADFGSAAVVKRRSAASCPDGA